MQTPTYRAASRHLLSQAAQELEAGDIRQASEKAWGAAAQMIKVLAEERGWPHNSHSRLYETANRLAQEAGDRDIRLLFNTAGNLHVNYYENWVTPEVVAIGLADVELLLEKLEVLFR